MTKLEMQCYNEYSYLESLQWWMTSFSEQFCFTNWELRTVNVSNLDCNCYFATAAGLAGLTTHELVGITETMQEIEGTISMTRRLLLDACGLRTFHLSFKTYEELLDFFYKRLPPAGKEVFGFAYSYPPSFVVGGHMICLNVWKSSDSELFVRSVDFQIPPEQRFSLNENLWKYEPPILANGPFELIVLQSVF